MMGLRAGPLALRNGRCRKDSLALPQSGSERPPGRRPPHTQRKGGLPRGRRGAGEGCAIHAWRCPHPPRCACPVLARVPTALHQSMHQRRSAQADLCPQVCFPEAPGSCRTCTKQTGLLLSFPLSFVMGFQLRLTRAEDKGRCPPVQMQPPLTPPVRLPHAQPPEQHHPSK